MNRELAQKIWSTAYQKAQAAECVWQSGFDAEALELALNALVWADWYQRIRAGEVSPTSSDARPPTPGTEVALATLDAENLRVEQDARELATLSRRTRRRAFRRLRQTHRTLLRPPPPAPLGLRRLRIACVSFCVLLLAAGLGFWSYRSRASLQVAASASYSPQYPADAILDGRFDKRHTEWLLPNKTAGWIDVQQPKRIALTKLRVRNAFHPPYGSYGTKRLRVEVFNGSDITATGEVTFDRHDEAHAWQELGFNVSADRVRIYIDSYWGQGGGLSEVQWLSNE